MNEVTRILAAIEDGDPRATGRSLATWSTASCASWPLVSWLREKPGQTLEPTALVHEAYLRLVDAENPISGTAGATSSPPPQRR